MLKYLNTQVTFGEVPNEVSLCINITGCKQGCPGCHSPYLAEDTGSPLNWGSLNALIHINTGISCVVFLGGDHAPEEINKLAFHVKRLGLKVCWYSGQDKLAPEIDPRNFDYLKIGHYDKDKGPLTERTTNQIFMEVIPDKDGVTLVDSTHLFWKEK